MEWHEVELDSKRTKALAGARWGLVPGICQEEQQEEPVDYLGGIVHDGEWGWVTGRYASEATLLVHRLATGERVARHTFWRESVSSKEEQERSSISCVEELFTDQPDRPVLLAVCLESWHGGQRRPHIEQVRSQVHLYSVTYYQVLRILDTGGLLCRSLAYLDRRLCSATHLARFDGCLAVATAEGLVLLIDLNYERLLADKCEVGSRHPAQSELHRIPGNKYMRRGIDDLLHECRANGVHLSVELDVARVGIRCLVGLGLAPGFAAGLDDGRILIYDLINFQLTVALRASRKYEELGPVERLCAIVPPDDPKPCFYICAMYKGPDRLSMLLHTVNYSSVKHLRDGFHFQNFYASSVRNQQALDIGDCSVTGCSTVSTFSFAGDNGTLLAILSWRSHTERKNKLVLFDMNQWYKDEMPEGMQGYEKPHYLAGYTLKGLPAGLALLLRPTSILHFVALQRYEEHFYPNSLTFDCQLLTPNSCQYYAHDGVQRRFLEALRKEGATLFLRPQPYHADIVRLRLLPQFCELNVDATFSKSAMYDVILSVALEHGCTALLDDCASSWLDGSFLCNMLDPTELSLATLTNWIVRRAGHIKRRISELCQGVFDYGGYSLDERERREFEALAEQMCQLVRLQSHILTLGRRTLTFDHLEKLEDNERALQTVNEYQKVLYWFIKQGLLPEGQNEEPHGEEQQQQPLVALRRSYAERRTQRRRLYIDTLTKETGLSLSLSAAYPPETLQSLLHVMLDPATDLPRKHKLLLYMLLDLNQALAKRFPLAFRMPEPDVRSVNCFWWLDRGDYKQCMAELYDNRTNSPRGFAAWEMRLLVETLLEADDVKAAMRVVSRPPGAVTNALYMDVLLANNCVPDAFHRARLALDERGKPLLERFFRRCIESRRYKVLAELCLSDEEEQMVYRLLQEQPSAETERVQLILLLLKSRYIEATNFMDDVAARRQRANDDASMSILSAYRATMAPVTQNIAGNYFRIRGKLDEDLANGPNAEHRLPLSAQLARQNARGQLGDLFQSCAISALWAENRPMPPDDSPPFAMRINGNIPFLRTERYGYSNQPQPLRVVRPVPHRVAEKRQREREERDREEPPSSSLQPRKRRRLQAEQVMDNIRDQVNSLLGEQSNLDQDQVLASDLVQPPTFLQQPRKQPAATSPLKIPTILKRRPVAEAAVVVGGTPPTATSTSLSQPKCFRFQPPIPLRLDSSSSSLAMENESPEEAEEVEEEEETDEIIMEIESRSEPRSVYSVESDEEEVFLSPLPTMATESRVSRLSGAAAEAAAEAKLSPPLMAPPAGPQPRGSLLQGRDGIGSGTGTGIGSVTSSGFHSFATTVQPAQTTSHSQFVPTVCSSKMYETPSQSQVFSTGSSSLAKISERTTICGDMESTELVVSSLAVTASSQWSMPAARLTGQTLRMLDTTLDMSTYDGGLDQDQEQEDITELVLEESEVGATEEEQGNQQSGASELSSPEMRHQRKESTEDDAMQGVQVPGSSGSRRGSTCSEEVVELVSSSNDEESENKSQAEEQEAREEEEERMETEAEPGYQQMTYFVGAEQQQGPVQQESVVLSPSGSSGSASGPSSPEMRQQQQRQAVELVSSNDEESTGSITTSRSVTHTPEGTFLPSDTNVSQTSSPRPPHGPGGDGSPRSLYRANSLETVDDLDTTKGSLEEEEEDDEDDCVIALDGTEVRGYVARPQEATACSSAELFAFKDECADEATGPGPCPSLSLGATVNSDSVVADIIELDSDDDEENGNEQQQQEIRELQEMDDQLDGLVERLMAEEESEMERKEQEEEEQAPNTSIAQDETSRQSLTLAFSEDEAEAEAEDEEVAAATSAAVVTTTRRLLRPRRNSAEPHQDSPIVRRARLRSDDSGGGGGAPPVVTTPKRRAPKHKALLEVIDEQGSLDTPPSLPLTRSRSRLGPLLDTTVDAETPTRSTLSNSRRRATSLAPTTGPAVVESPRTRRSLRGISEPPDTPSRRSTRGLSKSPTQMTPTQAEPKPVRTLRTRSRKNSSNDISPAVSPIPSESEQPRLRRTTRRRNSEVSDAGDTGDTGSTTSGVTRELRSLRRPVSAEPEAAPARPASRASQKASRTPTPTEGSSEAHVPPKKRGRPKK